MIGVINLINYSIPVVPHKAVAEVSKIGSLRGKLVVAKHCARSDDRGAAWSIPGKRFSVPSAASMVGIES